MLRALGYPNFRLFLAGQIISLTGTWMQNVAQGWLVYRLTGSALLLGATSFAANIPILILSPVAGVVADRYSRRVIVMIAQSLFMLQALLLAWLTLTGRVTVTHVITLAAMLGIVGAFEVPARQALMVHMTAREDLLGAISLNSAVFNSARVIGPSIGGIVVALIGEGWCFLVNAVSFLGFFACFLLIRFPSITHAKPTAPWRELVDGLRYAHHTVALRMLLLNSGAVNLTAAPLIVLAPVFADAIFHRGSRGLGFLMSAMGLGAVIGTLSLARRSNVHGLAKVAVTSSFAMSIAVMAYAGSPAFWVTVFVAAGVGFSIFRQNASANTLIQTLVKEEYRGRIMSLYSMMAIGMLPVGSLAAGIMAEHFGARITVFCSGILCLAAALVIYRNRSHLEAVKEQE